jgi:hypothetical protein
MYFNFRVYLAIATEEDLRGLIVQQGAAKVKTVILLLYCKVILLVHLDQRSM